MPRPTQSTAEEQVKYLLSALKHCNMGKPDFKEVAKDNNLKNANSAQKKYKQMIEASGQYKLIDNQIVEIVEEQAGVEEGEIEE